MLATLAARPARQAYPQLAISGNKLGRNTVDRRRETDPDRSREFYRSLLDGQVLLQRDPVIIKVANTWLTLVTAGGPTDDKPGVNLTTPTDPARTSGFLNVRVADIASFYEELLSKGADFSLNPKTTDASSMPASVIRTAT